MNRMLVLAIMTAVLGACANAAPLPEHTLLPARSSPSQRVTQAPAGSIIRASFCVFLRNCSRPAG